MIAKVLNEQDALNTINGLEKYGFRLFDNHCIHGWWEKVTRFIKDDNWGLNIDLETGYIYPVDWEHENEKEKDKGRIKDTVAEKI
jgi:hypothetical protein